MNVTTLIFLGLAVVWAVVLLPELVRKVAGSRHSDTIRSFNQQLSVLDRSGSPSPRLDESRPPGAAWTLQRHRPDAPGRDVRRSAPTRSAAAVAPVSPWVRKRRQDVLIGLGSVAVLTLICTVAFGGAFLVLHLLADLLLVAYLVALAQVRQAPRRCGTGRGDGRTGAGPSGRSGPAPDRELIQRPAHLRSRLHGRMRCALGSPLAPGV